MKELKLGVVVTTMNDGINRVKNELLKQLIFVDEIIISHQITDKNINLENAKELENILIKLGFKGIFKYSVLYNKGLSKNRNNGIKLSNSDIIYICDDDLNFKKGFEKTIKNAYIKNNYDLITFQAENNKGKKHFKVKKGKHNRFSLLRIWSWGITFKKESLIKNNIFFDENFGLGTNFPVSEENIFLTDCYKKGLKIFHCDKSIVIHPDESSGIDYKNRKDLIIARIKVFKRLFGFIGGFLGIFYFTILHYKYYKKYFSIKEFFILSFKSLINIDEK